jgi:hypothetical protein
MFGINLGRCSPVRPTPFNQKEDEMSEKSWPSCHGNGSNLIDCSSCEGSDSIKIVCPRPGGSPDEIGGSGCTTCGGDGWDEEDCSICSGDGEVWEDCNECGGSGYIDE